MRAALTRQRGAATLLVTVVLLFAMTLVAAFANRNLVFEQRSAANLVRSTQAFEAAEAGAEWALAMLNQRHRIGADCLPSTQPQDRSFRERRLRFNAADGTQQALTWDDGGKATVLLASCVRGAAAWACSCPTNGMPSLSTPAGSDAHPVFNVQFAAAPQPGIVRLSVTGCTSSSSACTTDAAAHVQMLLGLVPGLSTPPAAALTARDGVAMSGGVGIHHAEPNTGSLTVHSGGDVVLAAAARLTTAPGGAAAVSIAERDASLAALNDDTFFSAYFGLDRVAWREQRQTARLLCGADCGATIAAAVADGATLVWIDGDLAIDGPLTLGSHDRPIIVAASGAVRLRGGVTLHGVVYGARLRWDDTGIDPALVHGAVISQGLVEGNGAPDLVYDSAVLAALKNNTGSFARVPGSWKDF